MSDKKFNDAELLTDDELDNVTGGFRLANNFDFKPDIPQHLRELVRQVQENSSLHQVNGKH